MWIYRCFDGDVDMALAGIQHDLYFASRERPDVLIDGNCTLIWIWQQAVRQSIRRRRHIPWLDRHMDRIQAIHGFSHKLLQVPHEHIAAYHRWKMPRISREIVHLHLGGVYPEGLLDSWRSFLRRDIPELFESDRALVPFMKAMVYRQFDAGDAAYYEFLDVLMRRYGHACVTRCWWSDEVADRAGVPRIERVTEEKA